MRLGDTQLSFTGVVCVYVAWYVCMRCDMCVCSMFCMCGVVCVLYFVKKKRENQEYVW